MKEKIKERIAELKEALSNERAEGILIKKVGYNTYGHGFSDGIADTLVLEIEFLEELLKDLEEKPIGV
jgi:hypothetical protein